MKTEEDPSEEKGNLDERGHGGIWMQEYLPEQQENKRVDFDSEYEENIDLVEVGYALLDKLKIIIAAALAGALLMGVYGFLIAKPVYEATSKLYVLNASKGSLVNLSDFQIGNYLASDYVEMFSVREVHEQVREALKLSYTVEQMESMVTVTNPSSTRILNISVRSKDRQEAMNVANEYARVVSDYVADVMSSERPNVLSTAVLPKDPVQPRKKLLLALGFLAGGLLAVAVVVARFLLNDTIKSKEDIEKLGLPVFSIVPLTGGAQAKKTKRGEKA